MYVPCLFDTWKSSNDELTFSSFALITSEPNPEVLEMVHDRSQIFLKENQVDDWLKVSSKKVANEILREKKDIYYDHFWK